MTRDELLAAIKESDERSGGHPPVVGLDDYFRGNTEEESIAPNQVGYGRPDLASIYQRFCEIRDRDDVQLVLVSLHDEWEDALDDDELWPAGDCIHIYTSASQADVESWVEGLKTDGSLVGWQRGRGDHPSAPLPNPSHSIFTIVWD